MVVWYESSRFKSVGHKTNIPRWLIGDHSQDLAILYTTFHESNAILAGCRSTTTAWTCNPYAPKSTTHVSVLDLNQYPNWRVNTNSFNCTLPWMNLWKHILDISWSIKIFDSKWNIKIQRRHYLISHMTIKASSVKSGTNAAFFSAYGTNLEGIQQMHPNATS